MSGGQRTRVAVVFGGRSSEHAISCISAGSVLAALDRTRYDVVPVGITPDGRWVLVPDDPDRLALRGRALPSVDGSGAPLALLADPGASGLVTVEPGELPRELGRVDVAFPVLHGPYGEDGTIQGLFELVGIPYVGSGVLASALAMDKEFMKLALAARGLPIGEYAVVRRGTPSGELAAVLDRLGLPVFVKPARGGSSLGITRVRRAAALADALSEAYRHDPKAIVEAEVSGRELECGVLEGERPGEPPEASLPCEIHLVAGREFYDFEAKYLDEATRFDVPAELPAPLTDAVRALAIRAFEALGCAGLARVDFFLRPDGSLVVNEVNTMPGFTPASMFPRVWAVDGLDYPALVHRLVRTALAHGGGLQ